MSEYNTWFDIKLTAKDLKRLHCEGPKGDTKWYIDGRFSATAESNARTLLRQKIFDEYVQTGRRK